MSNTPSIFADGILEATVHHGVARLTLAQHGADGKPVAAGQLVIPLSQLPHFANGVLGLMKQIEARMKDAQAQAQPSQAGGEPDLSAVPGAFRFG
jgi:hypothetical protein